MRVCHGTHMRWKMVLLMRVVTGLITSCLSL